MLTGSLCVVPGEMENSRLGNGCARTKISSLKDVDENLHVDTQFRADLSNCIWWNDISRDHQEKVRSDDVPTTGNARHSMGSVLQRAEEGERACRLGQRKDRSIMVFDYISTDACVY